jgi:alpha-glucosidase
LLAAVNSTGGASGEIYIDDGVSINPTATRSVTLAISGGTLSVTTTGNYSVDQPLGNVTILGVSKPQNVNFSGGSSTWSWSNNTLLVTGFGNGSAWNSGWSLSWK